jgi:cell division transport system permease protein
MRVLKFAFQGFFRHFWLSSAAVIVMLLMFLSVSFLFSVNLLLGKTINSFKQRVDLSIYLKKEATDSQIANFKTDLENLTSVERVDYISSAEALERFKERHENDPVLLKALEEIGENPLAGIILVRIKADSEYQEVIDLVNLPRYEDIIEEKDVQSYEQALILVENFGRKLQFVGIVLSAVFVLMAGLIIFNIVRLGIYARQEEIKIMRLVGATAHFIRAPFLLEVFFTLFLGWLLNIIIFSIFVSTIEPYLNNFLGLNFNFLQYLKFNFLRFFGTEFIFSLFFGWLSASLALKKYLEV